MTLPEITTVPDSILRQTLRQVEQFDAELFRLASTMIEVMQQADGVGLAANQIGIDAQIFVYGISEPYEIQGKKYPAVSPRAVVNPIITVIDASTEEMEEGCLSIPHLWGPVARPVGIELQAQDLSGKQFTQRFYNYEARIIQHETDHLNGKLFLDYITDPTKLRRSDS